MNGFIKAVRWFFSIIFVLLFTIILTLTPLLVSVSQIVTNVENPKRWINDSGIYENIDQYILTSLSEQTGEGAPNLDYEALVSDVVTPEFAKSTVEDTLDSIYRFLRSESDDFEIAINQDVIKDAYTKIITEIAEVQFGTEIGDLDSLPACTEEQVSILKNGSFEDLEEPCLPPGINLDVLFEQVAEQNELDMEAGDLTFTPEIDIDAQVKDSIQLGFTILRILPYLLLGILLILVPIIVLLTPDWRRGMKIVAGIGITVSLGSLVLYGIYLLGVSTYEPLVNNIITQNISVPFTTAPLVNIALNIVSDLMGLIAIYSAVIMFVSILLYLIPKLMKDASIQDASPTEQGIPQPTLKASLKKG